MSLFPPEFLETTQVLSGLLIILTFPALIVAYYWWLPKVGQKIGTQLAINFLRGLMQILKSQKMTDLGNKGVAAREFEKLTTEAVGNKGIVLSLLSEGVRGYVRDRWGKQAEMRVGMAFDMIPFDADPVVFANLPQIAEKLGGLVGKGGEAKALAEELKMLTKVQEPVK